MSIQILSRLTETATTSKKFFYSTPDNDVLDDLEVKQTSYGVYNMLERLADKKLIKLPSMLARSLKK